MKKLALLLLILLFFATPAFCESIKVSELPEETAPTSDDLILIIDDPSGSPATKKTTISNLMIVTRTVTDVTTATYDLLTTDYILNVTYTATAPVTSLTLPSAQAISGRVIYVKDGGGNAGTNPIIIDTEGAETIDGAATITINSNYGGVGLYCDGTNWFVM
jgi:hypothetical protein